MKNVNSMTVWTLFAFNSDEDLVLLTRDGRLFLIDTVLGEVRDETMFQDFSEKPEDDSNIADAKLENNFNTLAFRTVDCQFFYVPNVS